MAKISEVMKAEMIEMYEAQVPIDAIAIEMGCSDQAVRNVLRAAGFELTSGRPTTVSQLDPATLDAFLQDYYNSGETVQDLLDRYGLTYNNLYAILHELGLQPRRVALDTLKAKKARMDQAIAMYQNHAIPLWKIQEETGVSSANLIIEAHKRNVPMRQPRAKRVKEWPPPGMV